MKRTVQWQQATAAGLLAALSAGTSLAQSGQQAPSREEPQPQVRAGQPARAKSVRRPVIDLERMAKERRPGQVLPGDPPPFADKPSAPGVLPRDLLAPIPRGAAQPAPSVPAEQPAPAPVRIAEPVNAPAPVAATPVAPPPSVERAPEPALERMPVPETMPERRTESPAARPAASPAPQAAAPAVRPVPPGPAESAVPTQPGVVVSEVFTGTVPPAGVAAVPARPVVVEPSAPAPEPARAEPVAVQPEVSRAPAVAPEPVAAAQTPAPVEPVPVVSTPSEGGRDASPAQSPEPPRGIVLREAERPIEPAPQAVARAPEPVSIPETVRPLEVERREPVAPSSPIPGLTPAAAPRDNERTVVLTPPPARVGNIEPKRDVPPVREQEMGLLDDRIVPRMPAPAGLGPARVSLKSVSGDGSQAQWRTGSTAWRTPEVGESVEGRIEVRAGIEADVKIVVDDAVEVTVARLGRVVIERASEVGGGSLPAITVARGAVEVRPLRDEGAGSENAHARVRTPDQTFGVRGGVRVEYDAFSGTRRTALPG